MQQKRYDELAKEKRNAETKTIKIETQKKKIEEELSEKAQTLETVTEKYDKLKEIRTTKEAQVEDLEETMVQSN